MQKHLDEMTIHELVREGLRDRGFSSAALEELDARARTELCAVRSDSAQRALARARRCIESRDLIWAGRWLGIASEHARVLRDEERLRVQKQINEVELVAIEAELALRAAAER